MMETSARYRVYVGTYTSVPGQPEERAEGIYRLEFDPQSGDLTLVGACSGVTNPSYLAYSADRTTLYAVNETRQFAGQMGGGVSALRVDPANGALSLLNQQPTHGMDPCHLCLHAGLSLLFAANYSSGSLSVFPLDAEGRLEPASQVVQHSGSGPRADRQEGAHLHSSLLDPSGRYLLTADLGIDQINLYRIDPVTCTLEAHHPSFFAMEPGSGPRHMAWSANGRVLYVINELASTLSVLAYHPTAASLAHLQTLPLLPEDFHGDNTAADLHWCGDLLVCSNRGHDSLVIFRRSDANGRLERLGWVPCGGRTPRNFAIDPTGRWLLAAHQDSHTIQVFAIHPEGRLSPHGHPLSIPAPVCILF